MERNFNTVEDRSIAHMGPATQSVLQDFMARDGVAQALAACRAWHRARFDALMGEPDALKLYGRLLLAEGSAQLPDAVALSLIKRYGQAHGSN